MTLNDRIAQALGLGNPERDDETRIASLVALVHAVDEEQTELIDILQERIDDLEYNISQIHIAQVEQLALGQDITTQLLDLLNQFQAESFDIESEGSNKDRE